MRLHGGHVGSHIAWRGHVGLWVENRHALWCVQVQLLVDVFILVLAVVPMRVVMRPTWRMRMRTMRVPATNQTTRQSAIVVPPSERHLYTNVGCFVLQLCTEFTFTFFFSVTFTLWMEIFSLNFFPN